MYDEKTLVDVLTLEGFGTTLEARLAEAQSILTAMQEQLRRSQPQLGDLPDAVYVDNRYLGLYDQHLERVNLLIRSLEATRTALSTIIGHYTSNEARLTANAKEIGEALDGVQPPPTLSSQSIGTSGVSNGQTNA